MLSNYQSILSKTLELLACFKFREPLLKIKEKSGLFRMNCRKKGIKAYKALKKGFEDKNLMITFEIIVFRISLQKIP
jgi:hypothetical protein